MLHDLYLVRDFNWAAAAPEMQQALAIDPTNPVALMSASGISATLGNYKEAERQIRKAMERDPLDLSISEQLASINFNEGRLAEAEVIVRSVIDRQPDREWIHHFLAEILLMQGKVEAALAETEQETNEQSRIAILPVILHAAGRQAEADAALKSLIDTWAVECAQCVAKVYAYMGDHDQALQWLERAYRQKDMTLFNIVDNPLYGQLLDDPRFKAFLHDRLKLPVT